MLLDRLEKFDFFSIWRTFKMWGDESDRILGKLFGLFIMSLRIFNCGLNKVINMIFYL